MARGMHFADDQVAEKNKGNQPMSFRLILATLTVSSAVAWTAPAAAGPILFTESTTVSGSLGTTAFSNALITVTLLADTGGVTNFSPAYPGLLVNPGSATLTIEGLGTFAFNSPNGYGAFFVPPILDPRITTPAFVIAQFDNPEHDSFTHIVAILDSTLATYDLASAFGPLTATGFGPPGSDEPFQTTGGALFIRSGEDSVTFTATTSVPEPSSLALLFVGALGLLASARRRKVS